MTDLRKAAEMSLRVLIETDKGIVPGGIAGDIRQVMKESIKSLRQALAQPEWVGLTDEEIEQCFVFDWSGEFYSNWRKQTYEAIKAKLKEKNI